jgi:hypothetical protein
MRGRIGLQAQVAEHDGESPYQAARKSALMGGDGFADTLRDRERITVHDLQRLETIRAPAAGHQTAIPVDTEFCKEVFAFEGGNETHGCHDVIKPPDQGEDRSMKITP